MSLSKHAYAALFLLACTGREPAPEPVPEPAPVVTKQHAIIFLIDTLRDDVTTTAATPHLDALAARGQRIDRAWSPGTWTVPSVIGMFTGMHVRTHGWDLPSARIGKYPRLPQAPTLAEVLQGEGFVTQGLYANTYLAEELGFARGFDQWTRITDKVAPERVAKLVKEWEPGQRHFLYVHLLGPHSPLRPTPDAQARHEVADEWFEGSRGLGIGVAKRNRREGARPAYRAAYHAVVEDTDAIVGEMLTTLEPWLDDSVVIVTSDHGELIGEHDIAGHGYWVWEQLTHVPLITAGGAPLPQAISTSAMADYVTRTLGVKHTWSSQVDQPLPLVSQREGKLALSPDGRFKGVWHDIDLAEPQVFDLAADPLEATPLPQRSAALLTARRTWEAANAPGTAELTPESTVALHPDTLAELAALGYVEADPGEEEAQ